MSALALGASFTSSAMAEDMVITQGVTTLPSLENTTVLMSGMSELRLTSPAPLTGGSINLTSIDSWLFLTGVRPDAALANHLPLIQVNGQPAAVGTNVRVVGYDSGTVIIPQPATFKPLVAFTGAAFTGDAMSFAIDTYYTSTGSGPGGVTLPVVALNSMDRTISSFKLKRGYMATISTRPDGTGPSQNYVAQDGDLEVGLLPANLDNAVQFVRVFPWRWIQKKGACDVAPDLLNTTWWYNWNNSNDSLSYREYVPTWQQPFWPGQPTNRTNITHHLGLNEPNGSDQDAYKNLTPPGSVDHAVALWPVQLATGLRAGTPAVTDGGYSWITNFVAKADAAGMRMDFVPIHYYRASTNDPASAASSMYAFLKSVHDVVKRPMWVTEFNNGANWTSGTDPTLTQNRDCIDAMIKMMDETPWIERYSVYSAVEASRQMVVSGTNPVELTPAGVVYRDHVAPLSYSQVVPATSEKGIARLTFDGDTLDTSGFLHNGLAARTPSFVPGQRGQAIQLDGTNSYVQLPANLAASTSFSFASWVYWEGGAVNQRIFDFGDNIDPRANNYRYMFLSPNVGGGFRFGLRNGADGTQGIQTATPLPTNTWQHVAVTMSGTTATLYLNGVQQTTGVITTPALSGTQTNYIGRSQWLTDPLFKGKIDDVRVFDKALTATQVAALMTNNAPQFSSPTMNGGAGNPGVAYTGSVAGSATDADGDAITYSKGTGPAWLQVAANGTLSGTPAATDQGVHDFTIIATDPTGDSGYTVFSVTLPKTLGHGAWASPGGGTWSDVTKWTGDFPASGSGFTADFNALATTSPATITVDSPRTIADLVFGSASSGGNWTLAGSGGATLTLDSGSTTTGSKIDVGQNTVTINTPLAGTKGLWKNGNGTLVLSGTHPLSGIIDIDTAGTTASQGTVRLVGPGGLPSATELRIRTNNGGSSTLELEGAAGSVTVPAPVTLSGRNVTVPAVRNIAGNNTLSGVISMGAGGSNYRFQSDTGMLTLGGTIRSLVTTTRNVTLQGDGDGVVTGNINNGTSDFVNVAKSGAGTWSLNFANTYTGTTTVSQGKLIVNGQTGTGNTTVAGGATLGGAGTINSNLIAQSGSKVVIGNQGFTMIPDTAFSLIDNFESYPPGNIGTVPNTTGDVWTGVFNGTGNARIVDVSGNKAMAVNGIGAAADSWRGAITRLKTPLPNGQTGTYFFRVRSTGVTTTDFIFGLSDQAATTTTVPGSDVTDPWNEYAVTLSIGGGNLRAYNQGVGDVVLTPVTTNAWTNVWLVVDNAAKTFRVAYSTGMGNGTLAAQTFSFGRRTGAMAGTNPIVTFGMHERVNVAGQIDDLHFSGGSDLSNPVNAPNLPWIAKGSTLKVTTDFTLAAGSTVEFDASRGALHDKLTVGGNFNASGTLKVSLDPAQAAPVSGDSFDIFDAATASINFASLDLPALATGLVWNTGSLGDGVLSVVAGPPPSAYASWVAGLAFAPGTNGPSQDADLDGIANAFEWLFGSAPLASDPQRLPQGILRSVTGTEFPGADPSKRYLSITATVRKNIPGMTLIPQFAASPEALDEPGTSNDIVSLQVSELGDFEVREWIHTLPVETIGHGFMRLKLVGE